LRQRIRSDSIDVEVAGRSIRLAYESSGQDDGPVVLLLHGWGSSASIMRPIAEWLEADYLVFNLDLPGHGQSPPPPEAWGVPEHAELVRHVAERLVDGPYTVVGHSNGGRIGLYLASEESPPADLVRLALIGPSGIRRKRTIAFHVRRFAAVALKAPFALLPATARAFGLDWLRHSLVWRLLGSSDYRNLEGVMRDTFVKTVNCYLEERLPRVGIPVLLYRGDRDDSISAEQITKMEALLPDAGLVIVEGAGHYAFLDRPDVVRASLRHFLAHS
jgi:pimeloyl-ACP methyl ester carboxylesterase